MADYSTTAATIRFWYRLCTKGPVCRVMPPRYPLLLLIGLRRFPARSQDGTVEESDRVEGPKDALRSLS